MATIKFVVEFPSLKVDDLVALVIANDEANDDNPVGKHAVTGADVLSLWFQGDFPVIPDQPGGEPMLRRNNGVLTVGNEIVHLNEMED